MKPKLLTAVQAAHLKGVSREAIYCAIRDGRLPHRKVLGKIAVREIDVLAWTPAPYAGRRKGSRLSEETRAKISAAQKRHWEQRKADPDGSDPAG